MIEKVVKQMNCCDDFRSCLIYKCYKLENTGERHYQSIFMSFDYFADMHFLTILNGFLSINHILCVLK
jgi:hypothetical protein